MSDEVVVSIDEAEKQILAHVETAMPDNQSNEAHEDHQINDGFNKSDKDLLRDLKKQKEIISRDNHDDQKERTKIQQVPEIMKRRDGNWKQYYSPSEMAVGPIHARNTQLIKRNLKLRLAAKFLTYSNETEETLLGSVKKDIHELKKCFHENVIKSFKDDRLVRILFLDGCAVLQFIRSYVRNELKEFKVSNGRADLVRQDLFLLENQIPFRLLKLLINSSREQNDFGVSIYEFVLMNIMAPADYYWERFFWNKIDLPILSNEGNEPVHLLDLLRSELLLSENFGNPSQNSSHHQSFYRRSFRNIQDLKAAGIRLKPSDSCSLRAISFSTRCFITGQLKLPPLIVDNSTTSKLWNLVAYEMCPDNYNSDFGVSSYLSFLDSLIDNEQDVRDLRAAHILRNHLSSDVEVAQLFNGIASNLVSDDAYLSVKLGIQKHYDRKRATWMAEFCRNHCSSPLTVVALFAAAIALVLTAFGTWFTVYPRKS